MPERKPDLTRRSLLSASATALGLIGASACKRAPVSCNDVSGLSPEEAQVRTTLGYTDRAPAEAQACERCQQWVPGSLGGCGSCKIMKGPVHPSGSCRVFAPV